MVPFVVLYYVIGWTWWLSGIIATLVAVSLSVIFLNRPREAASESIYEWRNRKRTADEIAEDDAIAHAESAGSTEAATGETAPGDAADADGADPADGPAGSARA